MDVKDLTLAHVKSHLQVPAKLKDEKKKGIIIFLLLSLLLSLIISPALYFLSISVG